MLLSPIFIGESMYSPHKVLIKKPPKDQWANYIKVYVVITSKIGIKDEIISKHIMDERNPDNPIFYPKLPIIININGDYVSGSIFVENLIGISKYKNEETIKLDLIIMDTQIVDKKTIRDLTLKNLL